MRKIELSNNVHISYSRTTDAVEAFKLAVTNGQARLALEMMMDVVDGLVLAIQELETSKQAQPAVSEVPSTDSSSATVVQEDKSVAKKNARQTQVRVEKEINEEAVKDTEEK